MSQAENMLKENETNKRDDLANLERQVNNLTKLVDINSIINSTLDISKLLTLIMEIIKDIMETEASTLLLYDDTTNDLVFKVALGKAGDELTEKYRVKMGQGIAGWVAEARKPLYVNDVYEDRRFDSNFDKQTGFVTKAILCTPLLFKGKLLGVIQAINPKNRPGFDEEDIKLFKVFAVQAALAVQNAVFFQNALEEERIKSELSSASSIQEMLVPDINETFDNIQISAKSISAREVGGEFHGLYCFGDNNLGIGLVDIHQKGIPGGLHASMVSGALKALVKVKGDNPATLMKALNRATSEDLQYIKHPSLFYGVINTKENILQFVNAGVAYPILVRNGVARYLRFGSKGLGEGAAAPKKVIVRLRPGDFFVILTDGILNIKNKSGKIFGLKRIMDRLETQFDSPESVIESLVGSADDFTGGLEKREDISIIVFKVG
ncbi:MAG: SpoIIE family protein phosphatase [bacterium]|nr:SpoIIE family protein phosphatase [bacterium]